MLAVSEVPPILTNSVTTIHFRDMDFEGEAYISDLLERLSTNQGDSALTLHIALMLYGYAVNQLCELICQWQAFAWRLASW